MKRTAISPASPAQRELVKEFGYCANCGLHPDEFNPLDPAHIIDRSLTTVGQDDARAIIPLGRRCCHQYYDEGRLDLLPVLESNRWREHLAFAVERFGLLPTIQRVTNCKWVPA
jgi:hypothetical protein